MPRSWLSIAPVSVTRCARRDLRVARAKSQG
jgi:hypothetical protein